jgi:hypothetical protein
MGSGQHISVTGAALDRFDVAYEVIQIGTIDPKTFNLRFRRQSARRYEVIKR